MAEAETKISELLIPPAVREEVVRFGEERIGAVELERADWIQTVAVSDRIPSFQAQPKSDRSRE